MSFRLCVDGPHELGGIVERLVEGGDDGLTDEAGHLLPGEGILERREEEVADHPLGLGAQHVEWERMGEVRVPGALDGQKAHLWPIAMSDHQVVVGGQGGEGPHGFKGVQHLDLRLGDVPAPK